MRYSNDLSYRGTNPLFYSHFPASPREKNQVLIIRRLQAYSKKVTKSGERLKKCVPTSVIFYLCKNQFFRLAKLCSSGGVQSFFRRNAIAHRPMNICLFAERITRQGVFACFFLQHGIEQCLPVLTVRCANTAWLICIFRYNIIEYCNNVRRIYQVVIVHIEVGF